MSAGKSKKSAAELLAERQGKPVEQVEAELKAGSDNSTGKSGRRSQIKNMIANSVQVSDTTAGTAPEVTVAPAVEAGTSLETPVPAPAPAEKALTVTEAKAIAEVAHAIAVTPAPAPVVAAPVVVAQPEIISSVVGKVADEDKVDRAIPVIFSAKKIDYPAFKKWVETQLYTTKAVVFGDHEGGEGGTIKTVNGAPVFVHCVQHPGSADLIYLNNSMTGKLPDFKDQLGAVIEKLDTFADKIVSVKVRYYADTRLYVSIDTNEKVMYAGDTRGAGEFTKQVVIRASLSNKMDRKVMIGLFRLICSNGMHIFKCMGRVVNRKTSGFDPNMDLLSVLDASLFNTFDKMKSIIRPKSEVEKLLESLPKSWRKVIDEQIAIEQAEAVSKGIGTADQISAWVIYQAMTYVLSHTEATDKDGEEVTEATLQVKENQMNKVLTAMGVA